MSDAIEQQIKAISIKSTLNKDIWDGNKLKAPVRKVLLAAAESFMKSIQLKYTVTDVVLTGSMAGYTYNDNSDIDVHILIDKPREITYKVASDYLKAKKTIWNSKHSKISIYGYPVEVCMIIGDKPGDNAASPGYSLKDNKWIVNPSKIYAEPDIKEIRSIVKKAISDFKKAESDKDPSRISDVRDELLEKRRDGILDAGDVSEHNLAYKILRNIGMLKKFKKKEASIEDEKLSLLESVIKIDEMVKNGKDISESDADILLQAVKAAR